MKARQAVFERTFDLAKNARVKPKSLNLGFTRDELINALAFECGHLTPQMLEIRVWTLNSMDLPALELEASEYACGAALKRLQKIAVLPTWDDLTALEVTL